MTSPAQPTNTDAPAWRRPAVIGGVIAAAVVAGIVIALLLSRSLETANDLDPSESPNPSVPASPVASPSDAPSSPSPEPTPVAAPDEWVQVATIGDGTARIVGGEIAWGDAGFLAVATQFEGGEGGPRIAGITLWRSADGQTWTELPAPDFVADVGDVAALSGAADGSTCSTPT